MNAFAGYAAISGKKERKTLKLARLVNDMIGTRSAMGLKKIIEELKRLAAEAFNEYETDLSQDIYRLAKKYEEKAV